MFGKKKETIIQCKHKEVHSKVLRDRIEKSYYNVALDCPYFVYDYDGGPALWHRSGCLHPDAENPLDRYGCADHCRLVWQGKCDKYYWPPQPGWKLNV